MNDNYRIGHALGRIWRVVRPIVLAALLAFVAVGMYQGATAYLATNPPGALR